MKKRIMKFAIGGLAVVFLGLIVIGIAGYREQTQEIAVFRADLLKAVSDAEKNDRRSLESFIERLVEEPALPQSMHEDFIQLLVHNDSQVQLLGAIGLYKVNSRKSKECIQDFIKCKDFEELDKAAESGVLSERQYQEHINATIYAVKTLAEIGDENSIPLLMSLLNVPDLKYMHQGGGPVEEALAKLGAAESLSKIGVDASPVEVERATGAVLRIKDPKKVSALIATAVDNQCHINIRISAIRAIGNINTEEAAQFLLAVMENADMPERLRAWSLIAAGNTRREIFKEPLLRIAQDRDSPIRVEAYFGLVALAPEQFISVLFEKMMDIQEEDDFRELLIARFNYIDRLAQQQYKPFFYTVLQVETQGGKPFDGMRIMAWAKIYDLFRETPPITLTSIDPQKIHSIYWVLEWQERQGYRGPVDEQEVKAAIDKRLSELVTLYKE